MVAAVGEPPWVAGAAGGESSAPVETRGRPPVAIADDGLSVPRKAAREGESLQRAAGYALVPWAMAASAPPVGVSAWKGRASGRLLRAVAVCGHRAPAASCGSFGLALALGPPLGGWRRAHSSTVSR